MLTEERSIEIFKTLADTNRLQLFQLLLRSDYTNSELMDRTQLSQNLLSHHLNVLSAAGLIQARRSIGDARRHYYSANLEMVCAFGQWWKTHTFCKSPDIPRLDNPPNVLFLCLRNSIRSLMSEAIARHMAPHTMRVWSAGMKTGAVIDPVMEQVLNENSVPCDMLVPQLYETLEKRRYNYVITVCDIVHESNIPPELQNAEYIHWSLNDPGMGAPDPVRMLDETRQLYNEIVLRLMAFVQRVVIANGFKPH